ncbi:MAG: cytochrome c3 family protein [Elusimicrobiota bacterium]
MRNFWVILLAAGSLWAQGPKKPEMVKHAAFFKKTCAKCHTIGKGDRVGPDLKGLLKRRDKEWVIGFISKPSGFFKADPLAKEMLEKFNGVRMDDLGLTRQQVEGVLSYIEAAGEGSGLQDDDLLAGAADRLIDKVRPPLEGRGLIAGWLITAVLAATLSWFRYRRGHLKTAFVLAVVSAVSIFLGVGGRYYYRTVGNDQGYAPVQPIAYSHKLHAGQLGISCLYCHHAAQKGPVAGIPPVGVCMNCHKVVRKLKDAKEPSAEIQKVVDSWESRNTATPRSIEWVRVHRLADYVRFNHRAHVRNDIQCQECHGPVQEMDRVRQVADLSMGWCVNCHRQSTRGAPTHWKTVRGPLDCTACHW